MEVLGKFMCPSFSSSRASTFLKSEILPGFKVGQSLRPASCIRVNQNGVRLKKISTKLNAVLMEPTDLQKRSSLLEFGRLSEELNPINSSKSSTNLAMSTASASSSAGLASTFSEMVGEALTTRAQHVKARSPQESEQLKRVMIPLHKLRQGGFVENCLMYRQVFVIRSYEVGADKTTSIDKIFSLFQEVALCHVHLLGIAGEGFGATRGMNQLGLIWVVSKMQVNVERYPEWPEAIEIDTWVAHAGKNGMRRDWVMRCYQTGEILARATSTWCMMNASTRRLSKIPDAVREEIEPCFMDDHFAFQEDEVSVSRIPKLNDDTADFCTSQLKSQGGDLDMNQHVNNLKYINWVFESIPLEHLETRRLTSITLEYRRECQKSDIVESLTKLTTIPDKSVPTHVVNGNGNGRGPQASNLDNAPTVINGHTSSQEKNQLNINDSCELAHLLRTQDSRQDEILRGRTTWQPKANPTNSNI